MNKEKEYVTKIISQLQTIFDEDCENQIDPNDFDNDENSKDFFHAIATIAPAIVMGQLLQKKFDPLEFNHLANRICAEKMNLKNSKYKNATNEPN